MKNTQPLRPRFAVGLLAFASIMTTMAPNSLGQKMFPLPPCRESVDKAISAENLRAVASKTTDPQILLGLAFLAQTGSPVRHEIADMAAKTKHEYAAIVAVLALTMDGADEQAAAELIRRDPDNALGYYLQGNLLYHSGKEQDALEAFRKGAACSELRLYESVTGEALFKALDVLQLQRLDRLCALSWMAARSSNFGSIALQEMPRTIWELARSGDMARRKAISDLLVVLAGHLFASNFNNVWYAQRALESAFRLKAEVGAAERSPTMNGYAAVVQALVSTGLSWPGINDSDHAEEPLALARFLPSRIYEAFARIDPSQMSNLFAMKVNLPESDQAAFEKAKEDAVQAAKALIDVALTDPDGIIGAYLKGRPPRKYEEGPWVSYYTPVEKLMTRRPDVFRAAATNEVAMRALYEAGKGDPRHRNIRRMMEISLGIISYSHEHDKLYPDNLDVLFEKGYLKAPLEAKSIITGRPYIYVAAGEKQPEKGADWDRFILLYDDNAAEGAYQCVLANGSGQVMRADRVKEQLRAQGK